MLGEPLFIHLMFATLMGLPLNSAWYPMRLKELLSQKADLLSCTRVALSKTDVEGTLAGRAE